MLSSVNSSQNNNNFTSAFRLKKRLSKEVTKQFKDEFITKESYCPYRYIVPKKNKGIKTIISMDNQKDQEIINFLDKVGAEYDKSIPTLKFLKQFYRDNIKLSKRDRKHINGIKLKVKSSFFKYNFSKAKEWAVTTLCKFKFADTCSVNFFK